MGVPPLEHLDLLGLQELAQSRAVAAGALDTDEKIPAKVFQPAHELAVAGESRRDHDLPEHLSQAVQSYSMVLLLVRVHAHCDHDLSPRLTGWRWCDVETARQSHVEQQARFYEVMAASVTGGGRQIQRRAPDSRGQPFYLSHPVACHTLNGAPDTTT